MKSSKKIALILLIAVAVLIPAVAILHAVDTSGNTHATMSDDDHNDHNANHAQDHDDNETSDDNSTVNDDANDNDTGTD